MRSLPPAITEITVPDCFSPSALGSAGDCRLKLIVSSLRRSEWTERLISGPEAAVGTLLHRVIERVAREVGASAEKVFEEEYRRTVAEIRKDQRRAHFAELASTKSLAEWTRLRAWVLERAALKRRTYPMRSGRARREQPIVGEEIPLESSTLRLRGKADRVREIARNVFEVRDFKTGATLDEAGEVKAEIALQLRAYGLMVLERRPEAEVRLVVDDGAEREVAFDDSSRQATREALARITGGMPRPGSNPAVALTQPGRPCWGCSVRHVCPTYRDQAPNWWRVYPPRIERLSNDIWGTVLDVVGSDPANVTLRDDSGRRVRIDGLEPRHDISPSSVGARLCFFGAESTGATRGFDGKRFHPRSFHEQPRDRLERRAWTLEVFSASQGG